MPDRSPIFSVRVGSEPDGIRGLAEQAARAEAMGFDQVWTGNDLFGGPGIASMAAMLQATSRIHVGSGVLDPVSLHPVQLAQLAAGFQELSEDRFLLGIGAGSDVFFRRAGLVPARPVPRTRAALVAIRALTTGHSPAALPDAGGGWHEQARIAQPRPVPIYLGAMGPRMLELAGRHADGALPLCLPPRHVHQVMERIREGARAAGRDPGGLDVAACVWCSIDDDRDVARRLLARHIARYSGSLSPDALAAHGLDPEEFARVQAMMDEGHVDDAETAVLTSSRMLELGIVGGAQDVLEQCTMLLDAGARHLSFGPPLGPDPRHALRILGEQVLPKLRGRAAA